MISSPSFPRSLNPRSVYGGVLIRATAAVMLLLSCQGCAIRVQSAKFPAYAEAMRYKGSEKPRVFFEESLSGAGLPALVPYAAHSAMGNVSREVLALRVAREAMKDRADLVVVSQAESRHAGDVSTYWGLGISSSQPVYHNVAQGTCYRIAKAMLGFKADQSGMVLSMLDGSTAKESGLIEGDTVLSVNGTAWPHEGGHLLAPRHVLMAALEPNQQVRIVWIRPGTGRMEGTCLAQANTGALPPTDAIDTSRLKAIDDDDDRPRVISSRTGSR